MKIAMTPRTPLLLSSGIKIERSHLEVEIHFVQFEWFPTFVSQSGVQILIMEFVAANSGDSEDFSHAPRLISLNERFRMLTGVKSNGTIRRIAATEFTHS
jgi:hypothetical protein